jgi:hypothetical protein
VHVPKEIADAVAVIAANHRRRIDIGKLEFVAAGGVAREAPTSANDKTIRMFANVASFGVSGIVDRLVNQSGKRFGRLSFAVATARATWSYKNQRVQLVFDGTDRIEATINTVAIANGKYFGGAMMVAPDAEVDDGLFDVIAMGDFGFADFVRSGRRLYKGTHLGMEKVSTRRARVVEAEAIDKAAVVELDVDGECPGRLPARFELSVLRAIHSNRAEALLAALLDASPPVDPFAPQTIVVGSQLVARWLTHGFALARGVAAGLDLVTFDRFVERTWAEDAAGRAAQLAALDLRRLAAALASVLADPDIVRELTPVAEYLAAAPAAGDRAGPRRVQLAEHLASLAWSYAMTRPDWMPALFAGQVPTELAVDPTARWQAALLAAAIDRLAGESGPTVPVPMLPWLRRHVGIAPPCLPGSISVFGMSFLARAQLEALSDLAATTDVVVYMLDPCRELWDDVGGRRAEPGSDPVPLVMWGRPPRRASPA